MRDLVLEITQRVIDMILSESYNPNDFFKNTQAVFLEAQKPDREPDYVSEDRHGYWSSSYWYTKEGVYRHSYHWSLIYCNGKRLSVGNANCFECYEIASKFRSIGK